MRRRERKARRTSGEDSCPCRPRSRPRSGTPAKMGLLSCALRRAGAGGGEGRDRHESWRTWPRSWDTLLRMWKELKRGSWPWCKRSLPRVSTRTGNRAALHPRRTGDEESRICYHAAMAEIGLNRRVLAERGKRLEYFTIAWNTLEGLVSVICGAMAGSVSLVAFGVDSFIEVTSG